MAIPSVLSLETPDPDSLHTSPVYSALPLLEPRVSGCKWNFVLWPFKRLSAFLAVSPWQTEILLLFTAECYLGSFPASGGEPNLEFRAHTSLGEPPATEISLWCLTPPVGAQPTLYHLLCTPYQLCFGEVFSSVCPWL